MKLTKETEKLTDLKTLKGTKVFPNVKDANVPETIQRKLTAGKNITIDNNVISATDQQPDLSGYQKKLTAGTGIEITSSNVINNTQPSPDLSGYQKKLTAGTGIEITPSNVINNTQPSPDLSGYQKKLTAGTGIEITSSNVINNTQPSPDLSGYQKKLTAGENITISDTNIISATGGEDDTIKIEITNIEEADGTKENPFILSPAFDFKDDTLYGKTIKIVVTYEGVTETLLTFIYNGQTMGSSSVLPYIIPYATTDSGLSTTIGDKTYIYTNTSCLEISADGSSLYSVNIFDISIQQILDAFATYTSWTHTIRIKSGTENLDVILIADTDDSAEIMTLPALCSVLSGNTLACHGHITGATKTPILIEIQDNSFIVYYQNNQDDTGAQESATFTVSDTPEITDRVRSHNIKKVVGY